MNKKKLFIYGVCMMVLLIGAFCTGHFAGAASKTPGSVGDPLITRSYLEGRLAQSTGSWQRVQLNRGQRLEGQPGTGILVMGGSVTATGNGLVDTTAGAMAERDTSMFLYHSYIVSEASSGCEALATCTLLVCGEYAVR